MAFGTNPKVSAVTTETHVRKVNILYKDESYNFKVEVSKYQIVVDELQNHLHKIIIRGR